MFIYKDLNRKTKASLRNDRKNWYGKVADNLETAAKKNNMREVYQLKNTIIGKSSRRATQIRDANGQIIKDEASRLQRWASYFEDLLNADEPDELFDFSAHTPLTELDVDMSLPTRGEVDKAIGLLKRNKAPGIDNITPELLKDGGDNIKDWLLRICQLAWTRETTSKEWGK